jgi:hypothetical protein
MRLDGIEIKVTIDGDQVSAAIDKWLPDDDGERRRLYFVEERVDGAPTALPLFNDHVILRVRQIERSSGTSSGASVRRASTPTRCRSPRRRRSSSTSRR